MTLADYLNLWRDEIDRTLETLLPHPEGPAARLAETMRYAIFSGGKRLRPVLALAACDAFGGPCVELLAPAAALELVHTYSLVHDDLPAMDDDDLRRGLPTCHKKFGEALAILAGDALLTLAFQVVAEHYPPRTAAGCCLQLAKGAGAAGMVGGQVEDLAWERGSAELPQDAKQFMPRIDQPPSLEALEQIHINKTAQTASFTNAP